MSIKQISPCTDWFYVGDSAEVIFQVAVWALHEDGGVVGLVSAGATTGNNIATLVTPPPIGGKYIHASELTGEQKFRISARGIA